MAAVYIFMHLNIKFTKYNQFNLESIYQQNFGIFAFNDAFQSRLRIMLEIIPWLNSVKATKTKSLVVLILPRLPKSIKVYVIWFVLHISIAP